MITVIKKLIGSGELQGTPFLGWGVLEHPPAPLVAPLAVITLHLA